MLSLQVMTTVLRSTIIPDDIFQVSLIAFLKIPLWLFKE